MKLNEIVKTNLPFVIFKKPHSGQLHVWQQQNDQTYTDNEFNTEGFYFAPFDYNKHPVIVIPKKYSLIRQYFIREFNDNMPSLSYRITNEAAEKHQQKVIRALKHIQKNELQKIIVSRRQRIDIDQSFDIFSGILRLMQAHDSSFVYLWAHPSTGIWIGATPELLTQYQNQIFRTVALAGTLPVKTDKPVIWSSKEIKEQQLVTDYIQQILKQYAEQIQIGKPKTVFQGKLAHIQTQIEAVISQLSFKTVLRQLHPTPAVCGLPTPVANKLIPDIEQYDRKYYTGFLGTITNTAAELFVNLRCMEIFDTFINLYVGGGIVKNSVPDKEWEETLIKSQILLTVFK